MPEIGEGPPAEGPPDNPNQAEATTVSSPASPEAVQPEKKGLMGLLGGLFGRKKEAPVQEKVPEPLANPEQAEITKTPTETQEPPGYRSPTPPPHETPRGITPIPTPTETKPSASTPQPAETSTPTSTQETPTDEDTPAA